MTITANYALLGATGQVGSAVLEVFLDAATKSGEKRHINLLIRSKPKLESQLKSHKYRSFDHSGIKMFETSDISNIDVLTDCIRNTRAVFLCVAGKVNQPGITIAQDQAKAVVTAMQKLRSEPNVSRLPHLVVLSSAEAEEVPYFSKDYGWLLRNILFFANGFIYHDLIAAEKYLRQHEDWLHFCIVKSGGIAVDIAGGHEIRFDKQQTFISYPDLAGGMLEIADEETDKYDGKNVSVISPRRARPEYRNAPLLLVGVLIYFFPWLYSWLGSPT